MQKKKRNKKIIIAITIIAILLILLLSQTIIQSKNKKRLALLENTPGEAVEVKPNIPVLSAGMIPVKLDGEQWVITTKDDPGWYDYSQGKPAYIMLNDGYYRSELERRIEEEQLMQNNVGVGVPDDPSIRGTIFMWIPRYAYKQKENKVEIKYLKENEQAIDGWTMFDTFLYKAADETKPDFSLTGVWVEKDTDTAYASKIAQMNQEESVYGFIANTKSSQVIGADLVTIYFASDADTTVNPILEITDPLNENRIILKIIDPNNIDPIKANYTYNKIAGKIDVFVTYSKYGISKVLYEETEELKLTLEDNNRATATTKNIELEDGTRTITIVDNKGNKKKLYITVQNCIYATLYDDGTLVFSSNNNKIEGKGVTGDYGDISGKTFANPGSRPWHSDVTKIKTVEIANKISPESTAYWFHNCNNLTTINSIEKLNTSKVTNMTDMFLNCSSLTELNVSSFDTSQVTNMTDMFFNCSSLTELNVSSFDTSQVTDMTNMFLNCTSLTELNVSSFDTSQVTDMTNMFLNCTSLTELNVSNFDTSSVTYMVNMFNNCRNLTELNVSSFNTSNVTNMTNIFAYCHGLKELDLRSFDTTNANVLNTFRECVGLTKIHFGENWTKQVNLPEGTDWYSDEGYTNKIALDENRAYTPAGATTIYGKSTIPEGIYVKLYTNGTMTFASHNGKIPGTLVENGDYGDISEKDFNTDAIPWNGVQSKVTTVDILNEISPKTTAGWFSFMSNLTTINNIENINTSNVTDMDWMFANCYSLTNLDVSNFKTDKVTNMAGMFSNCKSLAQLDVSKFDTSEVTDMSNMFNGCTNLTELNVSSFDTSNVTNMLSMFSNCYHLKELDLSKFDTSKVTNMNSMFYNCASLSKIHFGGNWKTQVILPEGTAWYSDEGFTNKIAEGGDNYTPAGETTLYKDMKAGIYVKLYKDGTLAFSSHDVNLIGKELQVNYGNILGKTYTKVSETPWYNYRDNVKTVEFVDEIKPTTTAYWLSLPRLTTINNIENLNTSKVTNMQYMFSGCSSLTNLDLSSFDTSKVTDMQYMFTRCSKLTNLNVSNFNTSNVTNMCYMFGYCESLTKLDISNFNTKRVTNMIQMFYYARSLATIYVGENWTVPSNASSISSIFTGCPTNLNTLIKK